MKTIISSINNVLACPSANILFRTYLIPVLFALITLTSCNKDDDDGSSADIAKVIGTYSVTDTFENGDVDT
jgi:hypothetical protein